jgi:hypothetical protein
MLPGIGMPELIVLIVISTMYGLLPICCWKIVAKTGFPAWWSLACLLPFINLGLLVWLAFSDWPALKRQNSGNTFP